MESVTFFKKQKCSKGIYLLDDYIDREDKNVERLIEYAELFNVLDVVRKGDFAFCRLLGLCPDRAIASLLLAVSKLKSNV